MIFIPFILVFLLLNAANSDNEENDGPSGVEVAEATATDAAPPRSAADSAAARSSSPNRWQRMLGEHRERLLEMEGGKMRMIMRRVIVGARRKNDYVRRLVKPDKYILPKVWGGIVNKVQIGDQKGEKTTIIEERLQPFNKLFNIKKSHPSKSDPPFLNLRERFIPLLGSNEKLLRVMMEYVQKKLEKVSEQYRHFAHIVRDTWPENVQSLRDAFTDSQGVFDENGYYAYRELTATWPEDIEFQLHAYKTVKISLKKRHLDNLEEMAQKIDELRDVVLEWPEDGCFMTFPLEQNIFNKVFLFDHALTLKEADLEKELETDLHTHAEFHKKTPDDFFANPEWSQNVEDGGKEQDGGDGQGGGDEEDDEEDEEEEDDVRMATSALLQAILKGPEGFTKEAILDLQSLPKWTGKEEKRLTVLELAKRLVKSIIRLVMKAVRALRNMTGKLLRKVRKGKTDQERAEMDKMLEEVDEDETMIERVHKALEKSKLAENKIAEETKEDLEKRGIDPNKIDHLPHDQLTDKDTFPHPFTFLQGVRYDLHIKPADKAFDQLGPLQYETLMEFYENPAKFFSSGKRLDSDTVYVAQKFVEPNEHFKKLYKKQYYRIHEFIADPIQFYLRGYKLDKSMQKAYHKTLEEMGVIESLTERLKNAMNLGKIGEKLGTKLGDAHRALKRSESLGEAIKMTGNAINLDKKLRERFGEESQMGIEQQIELAKIVGNPNEYFGPTEKLDPIVRKALKKALEENRTVVINALIMNKKLMKSRDENVADAAEHFYEHLTHFLQNPEGFYEFHTLNIDAFQAFRDTLEVVNDKESNPELEQLSTIEYQQFKLFIANPDQFLGNGEKLDQTMLAALREAFDAKPRMFKHVKKAVFEQLDAFFKNPDGFHANGGRLDKSIFKEYRKQLGSHGGSKRKRILEFFKATKLRFAFRELETELQFDQLMRFIRDPKQFYKKMDLDEKVFDAFAELLREMLERKRAMFPELSPEQYDEMLRLAENPRQYYAIDSNGKKGHHYTVDKDVLRVYTKRLKMNESCRRVKPLIETALYSGDDKQKASNEMRGRLGAQIINSVLNTKEFANDMWFALLLSLVGSGGIASALDLGLWHGIVIATAHALGHLHPVTLTIMIILDSLTPLFAETFDSFVIKRTLGMMQGKSFLPRTMKQFWADLKDSAISGGIAALGSIPNNIVMTFCPGWRYMPLQAFTNQIAASTSAAMVPLELEKWHKHRSAALYKLIDRGFFPRPTDEELGRVNAKSLRGFCRLRAMESMEIESATAMAFNSMGIGAVISFFFGFLVVFIPVTLHKIGDTVQRIVSIMFNTPTEILSLSAGILTANHLGNQRIQKWISTDHHKDKQMVTLIFERSISQLDDPDQKFHGIEFEEVYKIYHTRLQLTYKFGKFVVSIMNGVAHGITKLFKQRPLDIDQLDELYIDKGLLVHNWKPDIVYLVQFPRTSSAPSLSPRAIKLETWLKMQQIPFYRVTHGLLFGLLYVDGQVPFVEYNGQKIFGSIDEIIHKMEELGVGRETRRGHNMGVDDVTSVEGSLHQNIQHFNILINDLLYRLCETQRNDQK